MGFWSNVGSWLGENIIGIGQGIANAKLTNRQLAETELNNQFNRDLASKNYEENLKNNEFNRNLASANMEETLKNNAFNRNLASDNMAESKLNNQFNRDMAQKTYDFQKEQYENGVLNQAKQYEALGISPSAVLGGLSNMPSMSNSQASSSGFSGASTSGFSGANVGISNVQANVSGSNLQYNFGLTSSLLDIKRKQAEINNINADTNLKGTSSDLNKSNVNVNYSIIGKNDANIAWQNLITKDREDTQNWLMKKHGLTYGQIEMLQNIDGVTMASIGLADLIKFGAKKLSESGSSRVPDLSSVGLPSESDIKTAKSFLGLSSKARTRTVNAINQVGQAVDLSSDDIDNINKINNNRVLNDEAKDRAICNIVNDALLRSINSQSDIVHPWNASYSLGGSK
mgnify:CR=1 FL=1